MLLIFGCIFSIIKLVNDRDMLEKCGLGVCMINGDDETKKISDVITQYDNNHDGVAKYIEVLYSKNKYGEVYTYEKCNRCFS